MDTNQCPQCGSLMIQTGADATSIRYRCPSCGYLKAVQLTEEGNALYAQKKSDLLRRIRLGFVDWRVTEWDRLYQEIVAFISCYEEAQSDIQLQMSIVACITKGFNMMDAEKYKQCETLFKVTEAMYKRHLKTLKEQNDAKLYDSVTDYKESRVKYKKCRNEYRNAKLARKAVFFAAKKIVFH
ncbi:MAG: hypothetical protein E7645_04965 [Ruminococcaceae bacterium]|nr:hypothetical protein [Oscillospiraceae bacterium]